MNTKYIRQLTGASINKNGTDMYDDPPFLAVASSAFLFLLLGTKNTFKHFNAHRLCTSVKSSTVEQHVNSHKTKLCLHTKLKSTLIIWQIIN